MNVFMHERESSPVTDSPWFWVLMFSLMALGALVAIGGKYGRRQAAIERQFQARTRVAEQLASENNSTAETRIAEQTPPRDFATPGETLIPLWPLAAVLVLIVVFALIMLVRGQRRPGSLAVKRVSS
jgi:type VI protein secretion system component VasF